MNNLDIRPFVLVVRTAPEITAEDVEGDVHGNADDGPEDHIEALSNLSLHQALSQKTTFTINAQKPTTQPMANPTKKEMGSIASSWEKSTSISYAVNNSANDR